MLKLRNTLILILTLTITTLVKGQTNQKDSPYYNEFKSLIGHWHLAPISNNNSSIKHFSIVGFEYQENRENSIKQPEIIWSSGEIRELENGDISPIKVACPFDTTANIIAMPIDSLLSKFTNLKVIDDTLSKVGINEIGEEYWRKLENIKNLRYIKIYSNNCFEMEIFLVLCIEKKLLYIFSKYGLDILEKLEH